MLELVEKKNNMVYVGGIVLDEPTLDHKSETEEFEQFTLLIPNAGKGYSIPVVMSTRKNNEVRQGDEIGVLGEICFRSIGPTKNYIFAQKISNLSINLDMGTNEVYLEGKITSKQRPFTNSKGVLLQSFTVVSWRDKKKADAVPCTATGRNAEYIRSMACGSHIWLNGTIRSTKRGMIEVAVANVQSVEREKAI